MTGRVAAPVAGPRVVPLLALVTLLLVATVLAGCGVPVQEQPEEVATAPATSRAPMPPTGALHVTVHLVDRGRLFPVERSSDDTTIGTALALLVAGPDAAEQQRGITTALPSELVGDGSVTFEERPTAYGGSVQRVAVIEVTDAFTAISGDDQLLATAQVVWTVTGLDVADRVLITSEGEPIELPTDDGLTAAPVDRADYASVRPRPRPTDDEPTVPRPSGMESPAASRS